MIMQLGVYAKDEIRKDSEFRSCDLAKLALMVRGGIAHEESRIRQPSLPTMEEPYEKWRSSRPLAIAADLF